MLKNTLNSAAIVFLMIGVLAVTNAAENSEVAAPPIEGSDARPALIKSIDEKRTKKLARSAEKSMKKIKQRGEYIQHRIVMLDMSVLSKRDPMPVFNYQDGVDKAWDFEMTFTAFDGESFLLVNRRNYVNNLSGLSKTYWLGEIRTLDGAELLGVYSIGVLRGEIAASHFSFFDETHYALQDLGRKKEKVLIQRKMWIPEKHNIKVYQNRGSDPYAGF